MVKWIARSLQIPLSAHESWIQTELLSYLLVTNLSEQNLSPAFKQYLIIRSHKNLTIIKGFLGAPHDPTDG